MKRKHKGLSILFMMFITAVVTIAVIVMCIFLWERSNLKTAPDEVGIIEIDPDMTYTAGEVEDMVGEAREEGRNEILYTIKAYLEEGNSVINILKMMYPDYVVAASSGKFNFHKIDRSLPQNDYVMDNLVKDPETGLYTYMNGEEVVSLKGIDVSSHQGKIDWEKVAADDVSFAFIRALFRGYESGAIVQDTCFDDNMLGAKENGIKVGVYVFSQAINDEEAIEEANTVIEMLEDYELDLPIVYDVEKVTSSKGRMNKLTPDERTAVTLTFLRTIEEAGYDTMLYYNTEMGSALLNIADVIQYKTWFANYGGDLYWPYQYQIWQYSAKGSVDGIKGEVDLDIMLDTSLMGQ